MFLRTTPLEPPRAGMTANILDGRFILSACAIFSSFSLLDVI